VLEPKLEASQVTCLIGASTGQKYAVYSASPYPRKDEEVAVKYATLNTRAIISGVGDPHQAYCIRAMRDLGCLPADPDDLGIAGEMLFYPFDKDGRRLPTGSPGQWIHTNEEHVIDGAPPKGNPVLSSLFKFESLRGRPALNPYVMGSDGKKLPRYLIGVATCPTSPGSPVTQAKARASYALLQNRFMSHMCISADLARAILTESQKVHY
ncbi:unnamed protein product, partial [marine sediment metagenome]